MADGLNKVLLIGNLGADPELSYTQSSQAVLKLRLATNESFVNKAGERQERTEWHRVVVWGKRAEALSKFLTKGRQLYVEGRLQTRSWDDKDGQKRFATDIVAIDIVLLGGGSGAGRGAPAGGAMAGASMAAPGGASAPRSDAPASGGGDFEPEPSFGSEEDIPF
jgi:single-strand DNA-binding protein